MAATRTLKIGLVDLDTSHPASFTPILRDLGHQVVGVFESGTVWPAGYAEAFAAEHAIPKIFEDLAAMAEAVDVAIIHTCDWDLHVARCAPFVAAGKGVLIDKPLVGHLADAQKLLDWAAGGARIFGGSALRWAPEIHDLLAEPESRRGRIHTVFAGCGVDEFNYGVHAYAVLSGLLGTGASSARYLGLSRQKEIRVTWPDGRSGFLLVGPQPGYLPFYATVVSDQGVRYLEIDANRVYRAMLTRALPYLGGEVETPPLALAELLQPELLALAALRSSQEHSAEIFLSNLSLADPGYDGARFAAEYRRMRLTGTENFKVYTDKALQRGA
jgi:Oxidoreductase family, NAD-binding Rossmann fold